MKGEFVSDYKNIFDIWLIRQRDYLCTVMKLKPHQQELLKKEVKSVDYNQSHLQERWSTILDEYKALHVKLKEVERRSHILEKINKTDYRTILPIPEQTNHVYGWLANKPEFNLEIYGPDVPKPDKIPELNTLG